MFDQVKRVTETEASQAPFPGTKGQVTMQLLQGDPNQGPVVLRLVLEPGAEIAPHYHEGAVETDYILEGEFINEGQPYPAGTELTVRPNHPHGPHSTRTGVTILAMFSGNVDLNDFHVSS